MLNPEQRIKYFKNFQATAIDEKLEALADSLRGRIAAQLTFDTVSGEMLEILCKHYKLSGYQKIFCVCSAVLYWNRSKYQPRQPS